MTAFDKFSELDPAKLLREIDDEIDGDVFDQFSVLSPERVRQQLADNGIVVSNAAMLDLSRFSREVETALADEGGGEGGGDDALFSMDFLNEEYLASGSPTTIGALLGGSFDPAAITVNGLEILNANANRPASIGGLLALINSCSFTCVIEAICLSTGSRQILYAQNNAITHGIDCWIRCGTPVGGGSDLKLDDFGSPCDANNPGVMINQIWRGAFTVTPPVYSASLSGSAVDAVAQDFNFGPTTWDLVLIGDSDGNSNFPFNGYIRSLKFYVPKDDADLPTLSAPPAIAPIIYSNDGGATADISVDAGQTYVTTVTAVDPNIADVITYSISGGADAALFTINGSSGDLNFILPAIAGTYEVTVQASDGALTDTQTATVTVNAV